MKKRRFDLVLAIIVVGVLALLGTAVWFAVLRPNSNWHVAPGEIVLPGTRATDLFTSAIFLLFTAWACFAGGVHYDDYSEEEDANKEDGGGEACP